MALTQPLALMLLPYPMPLTLYLGKAVHVENMNRRQALLLAHA
jgi:hypothetical protein